MKERGGLGRLKDLVKVFSWFYSVRIRILSLVFFVFSFRVCFRIGFG